ncbi:MAG: hypothetical protein Q4B60_00550 [Erysipelotrichaceae bacterium]|nr:hypothetical protein [Erysipelotrichaceae bacterium]
MNSYNLNKIVKKALLTILAGICIGTGVGIILYANIGGDTITVFQDGMHSTMSISYGQASRLYNLVLILIAIIFARKYFGVGTIVSAFITGYLIDFSYELLMKTNLNTSFAIAFVIFMVGQVIYTTGLSILISCKLGMNALDSIIYKILEFIKADYKIVRLLADILLTLLGYLMGGVVGVGTVISIVCTGWMIDTFTKLIKRKA